MCFVLISTYSTIYAQQSPVLEAYIQAGLASNLALRQQDLNLQKNLEALRQAKGLFLPTVQFSANYTRAVGGRKLDFPIGDLLNPAYATLNQLTQSNAFPVLENQTIQFLPDNFHETKVKFAYPVFNQDLRLNRAVQEQSLLTTTAQKAALEHELRYQITGAYLQYLQALEAEKVWRGAKTVLGELLRFNQSLVKNNVATRDVVATAEYEISKADDEIYKLQAAQNTARAYFNFLINTDLQAEVVADTALLRATVPQYERTDLTQKSLANRHEFEALRAGISTYEAVIRYNEKSRTLPDAYVGGELGWQGFGYKFNGDQAYALVQAGLTFDIFDGHQLRGKIQQSKIEREKLNTQLTDAQRQIQLQVIQASNALDAARHSWETARTGLAAAEAVFKIVNNKYRTQQALLIEYLDAQNRVTTAQLQVLLAWVEVLAKEAEVRKAAGL